jgi:hypothetical protein
VAGLPGAERFAPQGAGELGLSSEENFTGPLAAGIALYRAPGAGDGQRQCLIECGNGNVIRGDCLA